jgi:rRNA-processing protein EBP2
MTFSLKWLKLMVSIVLVLLLSCSSCCAVLAVRSDLIFFCFTSTFCFADHMAKIKDRLIFENKKIEAVAQRKANKEQKLRAKESQANRLAEKAKRKREHFDEVEEWASSAAKQRGGALRDEMDEQFLNGRNRKGPNKKRQAADRKFGFGGKRGRFKQNDKQSMNDMSSFNPRGNFAGGMKRTVGKKAGSGASRPGKRARDAKRARR